MKTLSGSPVTGELIQGNGASYIPSARRNLDDGEVHRAERRARASTTGTNHWNRGLALQRRSASASPISGSSRSRRTSSRTWAAVPTTPAADITLDNPQNRPPAPANVNATQLGTDSVSVSWKAVAGASGYNVYRALAPRQGGQPLGSLANGQPITGTRFTDSGLASATNYYYIVTAVVAGVQSLASNEAAVTTATVAGQPIRINSGGPAYTTSTGALYSADNFFTGGSTTTWPGRAISGTNDATLYQDERWGQFTYNVPVANGIYDVRFHFVELYYGTAVPGRA